VSIRRERRVKTTSRYSLRTATVPSLAWIESYMPSKQDADRARYLDGFRRAGLDQHASDEVEQGLTRR
jgi:hypothetical protein